MNLNAIKIKISVPIYALLLTLATSGCAWLPQAPHPSKNATATTPIVTPNYSLAAKVISVNTIGRFVVLSFPASLMPKLEQTLFLYRDGLKVAEVRVTGPQQDNNTVADIISGEAQVGDAVRDQ